MYEVVALFKDTDGTIYEVGDEYKGKKTKDRLHELSTKNNKYNTVFIKEVADKK